MVDADEPSARADLERPAASGAEGSALRVSRRRPSFRAVLFLVILPQIALAVGLTAWLSYRGGRQSIEEVASLIRDETTQRIQENVTRFFGLAPIITQLNQALLDADQIDVWDLDALGLNFWKQLQTFDQLGWVAFGRSDGAYLSLQRGEGDVIEIDRSHEGSIRTHVLRDNGELGELLRVNEGYDPRVRPWYRRAVEAGRLDWTEVYKWIDRDVLCLDAVAPVYGPDADLVGVLDAGFSLSDISAYLASLHIGQAGRTFIVEPSGELVASSAGGVLARQPDGSIGRMAMADSPDDLVRASAGALARRQANLGGLTGTVHLETDVGQVGRIFIQATPLNPTVGLDWIIIVAVPESEFLGPIQASTRKTLAASLAALLLAAALSLAVVRWIARPLIDLAARAKRIQHGDLNVSFVARSRDEIGVLTQTMGDMVRGLRERERMRDAFGRYVDEDVVREVLAEPEALSPGGKLQRVTVLMSDLRGFSVLTARLGSSEMVHLLNAYLSRMITVIRDHGGLVNDFIGDAILALFGAPEMRPDDAERAMVCALAMQRALDAFNDEHDFGEIELRMGIGIDSGEVIVGNIGSEQRVKYGVIGDAVNIAARIESLTVGGQILVSRDTLEQAPKSFEVGEPMTIKVKGRAEALTLYELFGARHRPELQLQLDDAPLRPVELEVDLYVLSGKSVESRPTPATITRLGSHAFEVVNTGRPLEPLQNVKIVLRPDARERLPSGWYAKVRRREILDDGSDTQRCLMAITGEAERPLEERLRDQLTRSLAAYGETGDEEASTARSRFLAQLAESPIATPYDRRLATRILFEMACADGVVLDTERQFIAHFIDADADELEEIVADEPLTPAELSAVEEPGVRETMLMLAWATALSDAHLAPEEVTRLAELAAGLGITADRALELRGAAQLYLADAAFSLVWPPSAEEAVTAPPSAPSVRPGEPDGDAYADLIARWLPRYDELLWATLHHIPGGSRVKRILELGCGQGNLSERLRRRFPDAELVLVDVLPEHVDRCRRRFRDDPHIRVEASPLPALDFETSSFDLIVTSTALHHLDDGDKRRLFERIRRWLRPGGCLSYSDIFLGATDEIQAQHLAEWRRAAFALGATEADWAEHVSAATQDQRPAPLRDQLTWLSSAGFDVVDVTWKHTMWTNVVALVDPPS